MGRLQDKVVVVTGASTGFGRGIAKACAAEGANVVVAQRAGRGPLEGPVARSGEGGSAQHEHGQET